MASRDVLSHVVALANGKGGVGKTSIATTLAGMAAEAGYRVLLIDLDPQGNAGEDLGYRRTAKDDDGAGLLAALVTGATLQVTVPNVRERLDVIAGGEKLDDLSVMLAAWTAKGRLVADVLAAALAGLLEKDDYDLVVLDCPPSEPQLQLLALGAARWVVVPSRGDTASLAGMTRIAERMLQARKTNSEVEILGVALFGIPNSATRLKRTVSEETSRVLGGVAPLFESTIRTSVTALDARREGLLIHELANQTQDEPFWEALREGRKPSSPGSAPALAADYVALCHEILTRMAELETSSGSTTEQEATA